MEQVAGLERHLGASRLSLRNNKGRVAPLKQQDKIGRLVLASSVARWPAKLVSGASASQPALY